MSAIVAKLLDRTEADVTHTIARLEELAGFPSEDSRLIAENTAAVREKIVQLGLDPDDTTGEELFQALSAKFQADGEYLDKAVGVNGSSVADKISKAAQIVKSQGSPAETWALKTASVKNLLKDSPPKRTMKLLGYRSLDSLLKRQDPATVILTAPYIESAAWQKALAAKASRLGPTDFELREIKIVTLDPGKWSDLGDQHQPVISSNLVGAIAIWPAALNGRASTLTCALLLSDELQRLQSHHNEGVLDAYPSLRFWQGNEHLLAWNDGQPISLNLKDNCLAHLAGLDHKRAPRAHAATAFYKELMARYQRSVDIPEELDQIGYQVENTLAKVKVPSQAMAEEFAFDQEETA